MSESLNQPISKQTALLIAVMIESGLINYKHYIAWADEQIKATAEPEYWILELSITKDAESAVRVLNSYIYSEPFEDLSADECGYISIACYWLRYSTGAISWSSFLLKCGDELDAYPSVNADCSYFYVMLNELEEANYSDATITVQRQRVKRDFNSVIARIDGLYQQFADYAVQYTE